MTGDPARVGTAPSPRRRTRSPSTSTGRTSPRRERPTDTAAWLQPERVRRPRAGVGHDRLRLEVQVERLERELAAEAGLLVAAERDPGERRVRHVDADRPGLDLRRDPMTARRVARPD